MSVGKILGTAITAGTMAATGNWVGAATTVGSSVLSAGSTKGQKKGIDTVAEAKLSSAQIAADLQRENQALIQGQTAPGREVGEQALFKLADMVGVARPVESREGVRIDPTTGRPLDTFTNEPIPAPVPEPKRLEPNSIVQRYAPVAPTMSAKDVRERSKLERKLAQTPISNTKKRSKLESKLAQFAPALAAAPIDVPIDAPIAGPSDAPSAAPFAAPSVAPSAAPSAPSAAPSYAPQSLPSSAPARTIPVGPFGSVTLPQGLFESAPAAPAEDTRTPLTPGTAGFKGSPGYQFRLQQGVDAIDNAASARGLLRSGRRLKELTEFGQDTAAEEFGAEFQRLSVLAGIGADATQIGAGFASDAAANLGDIALSEGRILANQAQQRANQNTLLSGDLRNTPGFAAQMKPLGDAVTNLILNSNSGVPTKKPSRLAPIVMSVPKTKPLFAPVATTLASILTGAKKPNVNQYTGALSKPVNVDLGLGNPKAEPGWNLFD